PVLESQHRELGEVRVEHLEARLALREVRERDVARLGAMVVEDRVALAEGPSSGVLPGQAHGDPLEHDRAEGERFGERPVDRVPRELIPPPGELLREAWMDLEAVGDAV